jgi:hypothetical protein
MSLILLRDKGCKKYQEIGSVSDSDHGSESGSKMANKEKEIFSRNVPSGGLGSFPGA